MKIDASELELLIELMALVSKFGKRKMEKVISLLQSDDARESTICILEKAINLSNIEKNKSACINDLNPEDVTFENNYVIKEILELLNDKSKFRNIKDIDSFIKRYIREGIKTSKRKEKINIFIFYISSLDEPKQREILNELQRYVSDSSKKIINYENDLGSWSDIIVNSNKLK